MNAAGHARTILDRASWRLAIAISAVATALRVAFLGRLGLVGDEDISLLAVRAIAAGGLPVMPSGNQYWRAPAFHYLQAPLVMLGDIGWLRLTSVLAAAVTAALIVRLGSDWVGKRAAIVAGGLYALSLSEIDLARQMRFYALYQLLAFLAIAGMVACWKEWRARSAGSASAWTAASMMAHELGVTLVLGFLFPAIRPRRNAVRVFAVAAIIVFALLSLGQRRVVNAAMRGFDPSAQQVLGPEENVADEEPGKTPVAAVDPEAGDWTRRFLIGGLVLGGLAFSVVAGRTATHVPRLVATGAVAVPAIVASFGWVGDAFLLFAALAILRYTIWEEVAGRRVFAAAVGFIAVCGLARLAAEVLQGSPLRHALVHVAGPSVKYAYYTLGWPVVVAVPFVLVLAYLAVTGRDENSAVRFLASFILVIAVTRGVIAYRMEPRYSADLWPLAELLAAWGMVTLWTSVLGPSAPLSLRRRIGAVYLAAGAVGVALTPGTDLWGTFRYVAREPGDRGPSQLSPPFAPDIKGAVDWLRPRLVEGDRVAATDWLTSYCYLGRLDYWIRSGGYRRQSTIQDGTVRDIYLGAEVVSTLEELVTKSASARVWVIVGGLELEIHDGKLSPELRSWLNAREPVYRASDGITKVILLGAEDRAVVQGVAR